MKEFVIYTKKGCGYCDKIKQVMDAFGYDYNALMLGEDFTKEEFLDQFGWTTFPRVLQEGKLIGGYLDTVNYLHDQNNATPK